MGWGQAGPGGTAVFHAVDLQALARRRLPEGAVFGVLCRCFMCLVSRLIPLLFRSFIGVFFVTFVAVRSHFLATTISSTIRQAPVTFCVFFAPPDNTTP